MAFITLWLLVLVSSSVHLSLQGLPHGWRIDSRSETFCLLQMAENYKYQSIRFQGEGGTTVVLYKNANNLTVALGHVEGKF